ncbi:MAG: HAMP domain-containing histidine kinase [Desulfosudis oleivorans]|nr:HAMP domain-containing histidine kinase [Desulfosudis oleivorans]
MLDAEKQRRFISIIKSQVDRLTRLVENLLTVSRLESKRDKSVYKAVNLREILNIVLRNLAHKSKEHNIKLDIISNLPPVWADSDKLEQIMTNLIDNAIKYSPQGTEVKIQAGFAPQMSDFIQVKVIDQGIGIPEEHISKIFTKFSRIDNPLTRQVEGTGLGLYITKSLVESMGGKISVSSKGKGSEFTVKLAIATPEKHVKEKFLEKE